MLLVLEYEHDSRKVQCTVPHSTAVVTRSTTRKEFQETEDSRIRTPVSEKWNRSWRQQLQSHRLRTIYRDQIGFPRKERRCTIEEEWLLRRWFEYIEKRTKKIIAVLASYCVYDDIREQHETRHHPHQHRNYALNATIGDQQTPQTNEVLTTSDRSDRMEKAGT